MLMAAEKTVLARFRPVFSAICRFPVGPMAAAAYSGDMLRTTDTERDPTMNANTSWNTQLKIDTVAFSSLIAAAMLLAWFAAVAPMAYPNAAPVAGPAIMQAVVQPADQANDSRIVVTARRLVKNHG
jgi:hypothetical protein